MGLFKKKTVTKTYDKENKKPVIKASICNGEQVAGFKDIHTGKIEKWNNLDGANFSKKINRTGPNQLGKALHSQIYHKIR